MSPPAFAGPIKPRGSAARWSRVAIVAGLAGMAITLLVLVYYSDVSVRTASRMVIRGEAATLYLGVRDRIQPQDQPAAQRLATAVRELGPEGLRYIALLRPDSVEAEAGTPTIDHQALMAWARTATPGTPVEVGDRIRIMYRRPRGLGGGSADPPRGDGLVFELRPEIADQLSDSATRTLLIGILASFTLIGLTVLLVRWSLGREVAVRQLEQERHLAHLGQMSAVLAHEIRNPLASLKGNAQLLAGGLPAGEKARAKADRVVDEATRLETLTNDLLEFARVGQLHVTDVDPGALAQEAAAIGGDRVRVDAQTAPRSWPLDGARMRQVLANLVENAIELSDQPVDVTVTRAGGTLTFAVADRGPGITDGDLDKVFEPFFTKRTRGTGLGLAVSRRLVELHGGTIRARHRGGGGTVFEVVIPR